MVAAILKAVYDHAVGDKSSGSMYDRVEGRIYCPNAPDNVRAPYIVFVNMTAPRDETFETAMHRAQIRFVAYTEDRHDAGTAAAIIDAVDSRMSHQAITVSGGTTVGMLPGPMIGPERIEDYYQAAMDFEFVVEE
jgi:hypothetical protein